jgi:hypothetical protein
MPEGTEKQTQQVLKEFDEKNETYDTKKTKGGG